MSIYNKFHEILNKILALLFTIQLYIYGKRYYNSFFKYNKRNKKITQKKYKNMK